MQRFCCLQKPGHVSQAEAPFQHSGRSFDCVQNSSDRSLGEVHLLPLNSGEIEHLLERDVRELDHLTPATQSFWHVVDSVRRYDPENVGHVELAAEGNTLPVPRCGRLDQGQQGICERKMTAFAPLGGPTLRLADLVHDDDRVGNTLGEDEFQRLAGLGSAPAAFNACEGKPIPSASLDHNRLARASYPRRD